MRLLSEKDREILGLRQYVANLQSNLHVGRCDRVQFLTLYDRIRSFLLFVPQ